MDRSVTFEYFLWEQQEEEEEQRRTSTLKQQALKTPESHHRAQAQW